MKYVTIHYFTGTVVITIPIMRESNNQPQSLFLKKSKSIKRKDIQAFINREI